LAVKEVLSVDCAPFYSLEFNTTKSDFRVLFVKTPIKAFGSVVDGLVESSDFALINLIFPIILSNSTRFF